MKEEHFQVFEKASYTSIAGGLELLEGGPLSSFAVPTVAVSTVPHPFLLAASNVAVDRHNLEVH